MFIALYNLHLLLLLFNLMKKWELYMIWRTSLVRIKNLVATYLGSVAKESEIFG
ncbi:hypothetical protein ACJW30_04G154600 [Castanea mollissima]